MSVAAFAVFATTAPLAGSGALSVTAFPVYETTAPFAGSGALSVTTDVAGFTTAPFAGSGALSVTTVAVAPTTAPFAGSGALSVTAFAVEVTTAPFAGSGALSVTAFRVVPTSAPFAGSGALSVTAFRVVLTTAPFAGSGALSVVAFEDLDIATTAPFAGSGALSVAVSVVNRYETDSANNVYALMFTGDADVFWEPAVATRPAEMVYAESQVSARKIDSVSVTSTGMAVIDEDVVSTPRHRDRILVGGVDVTFKFGGVQLSDYELLEPLMYGDGGVLALPGVDARFERLGQGRLKRIKLGAIVKYQRVDEATGLVVATDYKGFVLKDLRQGNSLSLAVSGEALGRAALKWHPVPIFRKVRDAGIQLFNSVVGMGLRYHPRLQTIGIDLPSRGGMYEDQYLLDSLAQLTTGSGDQWTLMPNAAGAYTASLKDRETINATVYFDNQFAVQDLSDDLAEKHNVIWINAVSPDGQRIMHASAPNMQDAPTPTFPTVGGSPMTIGDLDADTSTGDGVTQLVWRLTFTGLLDKDDLPGGFDDDVRDAVVDFQKSSGCTSLAGDVTSETWDKLFDNFETGYSVQFAAQRPAVQDDEVQKFDRSGSGNIIGRHAGYDETAIEVHLPLDMGMVGSRRRAFKMAKHKLRPVGDADWVGSITLTSGLIDGEHNPGDPLTSADIIANREVRPGWNIWEPYFDGGTLFHVGALRISDNGRTVEALVDTRARDAMELWSVIQRNREIAHQPSRYLGGRPRRTIAVQDTVTPWDKIVGQTDRDWPLTGGQWTRIPVPSGQVGTIQATSIVLSDTAEFAALVTEKPIPLERLNRKVDPLADFTGDTPWWGRAAVRSWLKGYGDIVSWGTFRNPCGYEPYLKTAPDGTATAAALTGEFKDEASWGYDCGLNGAVLYLYLWVASDNVLPRQRVFTQQLDGSGV